MDEVPASAGRQAALKAAFELQKWSVAIARSDGYNRDIIEGSLEVKLPTIWRDEKQSGEVESEVEPEERKYRGARSQNKEGTSAENVRKVANRYVLPMICWPGGSKSRLGKAAGAEVAVQQKNEKWHAAVARSFFKSKCTKHHLRTTFANWDVDKWQAAVARSTFVNQNVQNTPCWDYFLKFLC